MASIIYESRKHLGILTFVWVVVSPLKAEWQIIIKTAESRRLAEGEKGHGGLTTDWGCPRTKKPDMVVAFWKDDISRHQHKNLKAKIAKGAHYGIKGMYPVPWLRHTRMWLSPWIQDTDTHTHTPTFASVYVCVCVWNLILQTVIYPSLAKITHTHTERKKEMT